MTLGRQIWLWMVAFSGLLTAAVHAVDVERFELLKGVHYFQDAEGAVHVQTNNAYRLNGLVYAITNGSILGASIRSPRGINYNLAADADGDPWRYRGRYDDEFDLENPFPNGGFELKIQGRNDGTRTMPFTIVGHPYPPAPVLNNFNAAQSLTYNQYNELTWRPFAGGTTNDFIQVSIETYGGDNVWESPEFGEAGALNGLATRVLLSPGDLRAGQYLGTIRFVKVQSSGSAAYPGAVGMAGSFRRTEFPLRAVSTGLIPDIDRVELWKVRKTEQTAESDPFPQTREWEFQADVDVVTSNQVRSVVLTTPGGRPLPLVGNSSLTEFEYADDEFTNAVEMRAVYGDGVYRLGYTRENGTTANVSINYPPGTFPPSPVLLGLTNFPNHPSSQDLVVRWKPWGSANEHAFVRVELFDEGSKVFETSSYRGNRRLSPNATSVTIPALGVFRPGHEYRLIVTFFSVDFSDTRLIPGALIYGGYAARTRFDFTTLPPNVARFGVTRSRHVWQRGDNLFQANATPFQFEASATASARNALQAATVSIPARGTVALPAETNGVIFRLAVTEPSAESLANNYPTGTYTFRFTTIHDGARTSVVNMASHEFPPIPRMRNFTNLAVQSATADFDLRWDPWIGANEDTDTIEVTMHDAAGGRISLDLLDLTHASTNLAVFRDTLRPNQSYLGRIRFIRSVTAEADTYPGARGQDKAISETAFYLSTLNRSRPFRQNAIVLNAAGRLQFRITDPLFTRAYRLDMSTDAQNWIPVATNVVTGSALTITIEPTLPHALFRNVLLP